MVDSAAIIGRRSIPFKELSRTRPAISPCPAALASLQCPRATATSTRPRAARVLTKYWHNPDGTSLGMLFPKDKGPLDDSSWAYVIEYDPMGYVKDDDANDIDYNDLLADMQKDLEEDNPEREKAGSSRCTSWAGAPTPTTTKTSTPCTGPKYCALAAAPTRPSTTTCACWAARACWCSMP